MATTVLSTKGQIVIPKAVREALELRAGTRLSVEIEGEAIVLRPVRQGVSERLYGRLHTHDLLKLLRETHQQERERERRRAQKDSDR